MTAAFMHQSVMVEESLFALAPRAGGVYADATLGGGGHAEAILEASAPDGQLFGIDRDPRALDAARERLARFGERATLLHGAMADALVLLREAGADRVDGLLADLGVSSPQLDDASRGFSFADGPLDMRMDTTTGETCAELIGRLQENELADVLYEYGDEKRSRRVARFIVRARDQGELQTTSDLRRAVHAALGRARGRTDPATRTFQALRIAVNDELEQLRAIVRDAPELIDDGGVFVAISFHSLEDRIVKRAFRGDERWEPLSKKPLVPSDAEVGANPRARSAKLRAARRVPREEVA